MVAWGRGNGWAAAAMAGVLSVLPEADARRALYATTLQAQAAALLPLQGGDGFWRASLLDPSE
jgi:unsaturated rhamnogalacturonyl hydrolase